MLRLKAHMDVCTTITISSPKKRRSRADLYRTYVNYAKKRGYHERKIKNAVIEFVEEEP